MPRDLAGSCKPDAIHVTVCEAVPQRLAQRMQAKRLPRNISVQSKREHERFLCDWLSITSN